MRRFWGWLARLVRDHLVQDEPMDELEFFGGGPKDGDREQVGAERHEWVVTAVRQYAGSPWGDGELRMSDILDMATGEYHPHALMVTGRYVRTGQGMKWQAE